MRGGYNTYSMTWQRYSIWLHHIKIIQDQDDDLHIQIPVVQGFQGGILLPNDGIGIILQEFSVEQITLSLLWCGNGPGLHEETHTETFCLYHKFRQICIRLWTEGAYSSSNSLRMGVLPLIVQGVIIYGVITGIVTALRVPHHKKSCIKLQFNFSQRHPSPITMMVQEVS